MGIEGLASLAIVNPTAGAGRGAAVWRQVEPVLREKLPNLEVHLTTAPGDGERVAARWGGRAGHSRGLVVAVGGDGSVHEIANGLLSVGTRFRLAIVPAGTGNDIAGNFQVEPNPLKAAASLDPEHSRWVDVGRAELRATGGAPRVRYFLNSLSTGVSARANRIAVRLRRILPGAIRYPIAGLAALLVERMSAWEVATQRGVLHSGPALNVTVANGPCFGGGLRISPRSNPLDGALDLVVIGAIGRVRALLALSRLRAGAHIQMPGVQTVRLETMVRIRAASSMRIELDGENLEAERELVIEIQRGAIEVVGARVHL